MNIYRVQTSYGMISVSDSGSDRMALVMIHGLNFSKRLFQNQFESILAKRYRLIAVDLPGHGESCNLKEGQYKLPVVSEILSQVVAHLGLQYFTVLGWGTGGNIAVQLAATNPNVTGLILVSAPPISKGIRAVLSGFKLCRALLLNMKARLTPKQISYVVRYNLRKKLDSHLEQEFVSAVKRCHIEGRVEMSKSVVRGDGVDQKAFIQSTDMPVCIINGRDDPFINHAFFEDLSIKRLFTGNPINLTGGGRAPFWTNAPDFNAVLDRFLRIGVIRRSV